MNINPCAANSCGGDACRQGRRPCPHRVAELREMGVDLDPPRADEEDFGTRVDWWSVVAAATIVAFTITASHFYPWGFH